MIQLNATKIEKLKAWVSKNYEVEINIRDNETVWYEGGKYFINQTERLYLEGVPASKRL